jgi:hypothetical protein
MSVELSIAAAELWREAAMVAETEGRTVDDVLVTALCQVVAASPSDDATAELTRYRTAVERVAAHLDDLFPADQDPPDTVAHRRT